MKKVSFTVKEQDWIKERARNPKNNLMEQFFETYIEELGRQFPDHDRFALILLVEHFVVSTLRTMAADYMDKVKAAEPDKIENLLEGVSALHAITFPLSTQEVEEIVQGDVNIPKEGARGVMALVRIGGDDVSTGVVMAQIARNRPVIAKALGAYEGEDVGKIDGTPAVRMKAKTNKSGDNEFAQIFAALASKLARIKANTERAKSGTDFSDS